MQGSDATANLLAHVFGCGALVRGGAVQDPAAAGAVTTMLLAAAARKTFLREVATEVLLEMAGQQTPHSPASMPRDTRAEEMEGASHCVS